MLHFRDEIRKSFLWYAFIPSALFIGLVIILSFAFWVINVTGFTRQENTHISQSLEKIILDYISVSDSVDFDSISELIKDKNKLSFAYTKLKELALACEIPANFVLLSSDFSIVLQGSSNQVIKIPPYQRNISWGLLGHLKKAPEGVLVEVSSDYSISGLEEIVIGRTLFGESGLVEGYLVFLISAKDVLKSLWTINTPFIITDRFGYVFTSTSLYYIDQYGKFSPNNVTWEDEKQKIQKIIFSSALLDNTFVVYSILDISQLRTALFTILGITSSFLCLLVIGMFLSASKIAGQKAQTIEQLVKAFKDVESGILDKTLTIETNIEFKTIVDAYNKMLGDIQQLIEKNKRQEKEKFLSELKQLEMQFNPHFLFNTLENIKFMIKLDPFTAQKTIIYLSEILRYSIDNKTSMVRLEDDIHYLESYLQIVKVRFTRNFTYSINISPLAQHIVVPKLLLQPLIENSVKYGFNNKERLDIKITGQIQHNWLILSIVDNGAGFEREKLTQIQKLLRSTHNESQHIGIFNVHRRIQLVYGPSYGLEIKSKKDFGTRVRIILPLQEVGNDTNSSGRR